MPKHRMLISAIWMAVFVFWSLRAFAQSNQWSRTYGGNSEDRGRFVHQTRDGGYIVAGRTYSFGAGQSDIHLIKTDSLGDTLWTRTYGGSSWDYGECVQETRDGGYIVAGFTVSFDAGNWDACLIKTDSLGDTLWARTYGGSENDECFYVQQTTDGGYILAGKTFSFGAGESDVYLIKTDSLGDTLWARTYGGSSWDYCDYVQQTTDGGYIAAGFTESFGAGESDVYLIKTDPLGDTLWTRTYGGSNWDSGKSAQQTRDGGYIAAGFTASFGAGSYDAYLIKTDSVGHPLWARTYGGGYLDIGSSVHQTSDGGYIVVGRTGSFGAGESDVYLIKTDSLGETLWSRTYGGSEDDFAHSVQQTIDGGYIVGGMTNSFGAGDFDVMLTKLDSLGNTCFGEFASTTTMSVCCTVSSPATAVASLSPGVLSPAPEVTSPATEVTTICIFLRGSANGDGVIDIADVIYLTDYLFIDGPVPDPVWLGDANCDGVVDIGDVVYLINYLFIEGAPPAC